MKRLIQLFFVVGLIFVLQSCTEERSSDNPDNLAAPSIPPSYLFTIPTKSFGFVGDKETSSTRNDKSNWIFAGANVLVWNSVVFANTAVPIAAFGKAFDYDAKYLGDLTWEWKYEYQSPEVNGSKKFDVALTGELISNMEEVAWTMTVTEQGTNNSFVWYEGIVTKDHTTGSFTINKNVNVPVAEIQIDFTKNVSTNDINIKFSNITENSVGFGDYIEWRTDNGSEYDRVYDVFTNNNLLEIESNNADDNGRVKDPKHFNDSEWHCWKSNKVNIEC